MYKVIDKKLLKTILSELKKTYSYEDLSKKYNLNLHFLKRKIEEFYPKEFEIIKKERIQLGNKKIGLDVKKRTGKNHSRTISLSDTKIIDKISKPNYKSKADYLPLEEIKNDILKTLDYEYYTVKYSVHINTLRKWIKTKYPEDFMIIQNKRRSLSKMKKIS